MLSKNNPLISTLLLLVAASQLTVSAGSDQLNTLSGSKNEPQFVHTWKVADSDQESVDLKVTVIPEDRKPVSIGSLVQIRKDDKIIYAFDPGLYPECVLTLDDGNLAVLWSHANGAFTLDVFAYKNGKVHNVLDASGGKMRPEFVYQSHAHLMGESFSDKDGKIRIRGGPFFKQRIIIPLTNWTPRDKAHQGFGHSDYLPLSADIYVWDDKQFKYKVQHKVPWNQRLRGL